MLLEAVVGKGVLPKASVLQVLSAKLLFLKVSSVKLLFVKLPV